MLRRVRSANAKEGDGHRIESWSEVGKDPAGNATLHEIPSIVHCQWLPINFHWNTRWRRIMCICKRNGGCQLVQGMESTCSDNSQSQSANLDHTGSTGRRSEQRKLTHHLRKCDHKAPMDRPGTILCDVLLFFYDIVLHFESCVPTQKSSASQSV